MSEDYLLEKNATLLVAMIRSYWKAKGFYPIVTIEREKTTNGLLSRVACIRSNMLNGKPRHQIPIF